MSLPPTIRPQKTCYPSCPKTVSKCCFLMTCLGAPAFRHVITRAFQENVALGHVFALRGTCLLSCHYKIGKSRTLACQTLAFLKEVEAHDLLCWTRKHPSVSRACECPGDHGNRSDKRPIPSQKRQPGPANCIAILKHRYIELVLHISGFKI